MTDNEITYEPQVAESRLCPLDALSWVSPTVTSRHPASIADA